MCKAEPHGKLVAAICFEQKSLILWPIPPYGDVEEPALTQRRDGVLFGCDPLSPLPSESNTG